MKIVFMGTPDYATCILKEILRAGIEVPLLVTQPDKPVGRKQILTPPHIKKWVQDNHIDMDISQPKSLREKGIKEKISHYKPDFIVVAAYGQILPLEILNICPCINLHASLLPKYRGASPIQSTILQNDDLTGVTAMLMQEGLDDGDILALRYIEAKGKRVDKLFDELSFAAASLSIKVLNNFYNILPIKQNNADATYCIKIKKNNGLLDFDRNALEIYQKYLAYTPWPGIFLENGLKLKKLELDETERKNSTVGMIEDITHNYITVACRIGLLKIFIVQAPSKKEISSVEYIRGKRLKIGSKLV
jgi:methionyl-tRNA formyltransferase